MLKKVEVFGRRSATLIQGQSVTSVEVALGADMIREQEFEVDDAITIVEAGRAGKRYQYFYSKGKISLLPANFVFPQMTLCQFITSWFCGNASTGTVRIRMLEGKEIADKIERYKLSQMQALMKAVERRARELGVWPYQRVGEWDVGIMVQLHERVNHLFRYPSKTSKIH
jgi:hypothetical protein